MHIVKSCNDFQIHFWRILLIRMMNYIILSEIAHNTPNKHVSINRNKFTDFFYFIKIRRFYNWWHQNWLHNNKSVAYIRIHSIVLEILTAGTLKKNDAKKQTNHVIIFVYLLIFFVYNNFEKNFVIKRWKWFINHSWRNHLFCCQYTVANKKFQRTSFKFNTAR